MKTLLHVLILLVVLSVATSPHAETALYVTSDPEVLPCGDVVDDGMGIKSIYVTFTLSPAKGFRFAIVEDPGVTLSYVGETHLVSSTSGSVHDGLTVCLADCTEPTPLVRVDYMSHGTSGVCSEIRVVPAPGFDGVDIVDCGGDTSGALVSPLRVNAQFPDCVANCDPILYLPSSSGFSCQPVPVHETTWGAIKALYD